MFDCVQGLKFERYECMGFTYWASGLERPVIDDHAEAPIASGRLSVLQSVLADIRSLLQSDGEPPAAHGPLDFFTSQAQVPPVPSCLQQSIFSFLACYDLKSSRLSSLEPLVPHVWDSCSAFCLEVPCVHARSLHAIMVHGPLAVLPEPSPL